MLISANERANIVASFLGEIRRTLRHPIATDAGVLAASQYLCIGLGLITAVLAARLLGPREYGIAILVMTFPRLLRSCFSLKSVSVTTRYIANFRATKRTHELKSICKLGFCLDFLASMITLTSVGLVGWWVAHYIYDLPGVFWLMFSYAASFPFYSLMGTSTAILSSFQQFRLLSIFQFLDRVITFFLVLGFLLAGFRVSGMVIGNAIGHGAIGVIMMVGATYTLCRDGYGFWWNASLRKLSPLLRELRSFLGWNFITVTLNGLIVQVPLMLLGRLRGPEEAGFYHLATSMITVGSYSEGSLGRVTYPFLSARWGSEAWKNVKIKLKRWTMRGGFPLGVLLLVTIPFFPILIPLVFGHAYTPMVFGVQVMMAGAAFSALFFWLHSLYYSAGKFALWSKGYLVFSVFVLGLAWPCIQQWGFMGLAWLIAIAKAIFTLSMVGLIMGPGISVNYGIWSTPGK